MVGDAGEHIGDIMLRVESVELGAFDQRIDRGGAAAAGIGAGKRVILAANARLGQPDGISPSRMAEMLEVDKAGSKVRC